MSKDALVETLRAIAEASGKSGRALSQRAADALAAHEAEQGFAREAKAEQDAIDAAAAAAEDRWLHGLSDVPIERKISVELDGLARWLSFANGAGEYGNRLTDREKLDHGWCDGCFTAGKRVRQRFEVLTQPIRCDECHEREQAEAQALVVERSAALNTEAAQAAERAAKIARLES
jgi:hypothetical protein